MAARGRSQLSSPYTFEPLEKLASSTLKRHPKMELNKTDLLKLLSVLEAEVQAREIIIAVLKAEQVKQLLYPKKKTISGFGSDPLSALQRDVFGAFDPNFDEGAVRSVYNLQLHQLEMLITQQRKVQVKLQEQLKEANESYAKAISELEDERRKHAQDTAQGDDVTYLLEKERERLRQEVDFERQQHKRLEKEAKKLAEALEDERSRQKQIVLVLLDERKRLILRLLDEKQKNIELNEILNDEKGRLEDMVEGLEEESKKSLQMEAELERQLSEFDYERESFKVQLETMEIRNQELLCEVDRLNTEMEAMKLQHQLNSEQRPTPPIHLGEGVRSAIVTMVTTPPTIRAVPTVAPTVSPPRGMAKAVSPKTTVAPPATPAKPPGLIVHMPPKIVANPAVSKSVSPVQPNIVTAATTKGAKSVKINPESETVAESEETAPSEENSVKPTVALPVVKPTLTVNPATATVTRKPQPANRGTPPPIPPNKPVLTPQALNRKDLGPKPPVPPRSDMVDLSVDGSKVSKVVRSLAKPLEAVAKSTPVEQQQQQQQQQPQQQVGIKDGWSISCNSISCTTSSVTTTIPTSTATTAALVSSGLIPMTGNASSSDSSTLDMFGQELVDFQQLLVSMASGQWPEVI